MQFLVETPFKN